MTTNEITRADELLRDIESESTAVTPYVDPATGEVIPAPPPPGAIQANPYIGIAAAPFSPEANAILTAAIPEDDIEVRPDGLIYYPEMQYRRTLARAFGVGGWSILPMEITASPADNMLYYKGALFVLGRFVAEAIGEQQYFPDNDRMSYATAAEAAKSNCLMRCAKDLTIASELWIPSFSKGWLARNAVEVWCVNVGNRDKGKKKKLWRKKTAPAIDAFPWKEDGPAHDGAAPVYPIDQPRHPANGAPQSRGAAKPDRRDIGAPNDADAYHDYHGDAPTGSSAGNGAPKNEGPIISFKQVGRFRAIARSNGWTENEQARLLSKFGFGRGEEIAKDAYDRICAALENPVILTEVRAEMDEEADGGF